MQRWNPGTIIDTTGSKYIAGPMGNKNAPNYMDILQASIRLQGARWNMPEYMISADGSNANLASTLIVGSPFVQSRLTDQLFYRKRYTRVFWFVLEIAYYGGAFKGFDLTWDQIKDLIDIQCTSPDIAIGDDLKSAQQKAIERVNGVLSTRTWIKETGRDVDVELKQMADEKAEDEATAQRQASLGIGQPTQGKGDTIIAQQRKLGAPAVHDEQLGGGNNPDAQPAVSEGFLRPLDPTPANPWQFPGTKKGRAA
jgi:hypothetical protein